MLPPPNTLLGLPNGPFPSWYPGQEAIQEQLWDWLAGPERFGFAALPTGFGKSMLGMVTGQLRDDVGPGTLEAERLAYSTYSKPLERQIMDHFGAMGMTLIEGKANYRCLVRPVPVTWGPCIADKGRCEVKAQCPYYSRKWQAQAAARLTTNQDYWLAQNHYSDGFKTEHGRGIDLLILDEAHLTPAALDRHVAVTLTPWDRDCSFKHQPRDWDKLQWEAKKALPKVLAALTPVDPLPPEMQHRLEELAKKLTTLKDAEGEWIISDDGDTLSASPLWSTGYADRLWQKVPKVLLMSALLTPKVTDLLGVTDHGTWITANSPIPADRNPVTHVQTVRLNHQTQPEEWLSWARQIDNIIRQRQDRKGIVFMSSYQQTQRLVRLSQFSQQMVVHNSDTTWSQVQEFKSMAAPATLVSPSVNTGYDFPDDDCRYIIIGKLPFPSLGDPLVRARKEADVGWYNWQTMMQLVQAAGRGSRHPEDWCEVLVVDDAWEGWWRWNKKLAPEWFRERVTGTTAVIPEPGRG